MPGVTLYEMSIPVMTHSLQNLSAILSKAAEHASSAHVAPEELLNHRLIADMWSLPAQIQRASDTAKGVAMRLGGLPPVSMADNEATFDELQARIAKTVDVLKAVKPDSMDGKEDQVIQFKAGTRVLEMTGLEYLQNFALGNFFFHVVTAYDILRAQGVPIGKRDYLGDTSKPKSA